MGKGRLYLEQDLTEKFSGALTFLLNTVSEKVNLTTEERNSLTRQLANVKYNNRNLIEIYSKQLMEAWNGYKAPVLDLTDVISEYEQYKIQQISAANRARADRHDDDDDDANDDSPLIPQFLDAVVQLNNATYRLDPRTGVADVKHPIRFVGKIKLELFDDLIARSPVTNIIDLNKTLKVFLLESSRLGFSREDFAKLLKLFVHREFPHHYSSLSYLTTPSQIFETVVGMLDFSSLLAAINQSLKTMVRKVGTGISTTLLTYRSLVHEMLNITCPFSTESANLQEAERETSKVIKYFVMENLYEELYEYRRQYKQQTQRFLPLVDQITFISDLELQPEFALTSDKSLDTKNINLSLFYTDSDSRSTDVHTKTVNERHHQYANQAYTPSTRSRPLPPFQPLHRWGSKNSLKSNSPDRFETPKASRDSRSRQRSGPRKIYYRTNSGAFRSVSQSRDTSNGTNRVSNSRKSSRSSSRYSSRLPLQRQKEEPERCKLCLKKHDQPCKKYGSIRPTKVPCHICSAFHPPSICLERPSTPLYNNPGSRSSSPGPAVVNKHLN